MKETFYHNLKENFAKIRFLFSSNCLDYNKIDAVVGDLKFSRKQIEKYGNKRVRTLLLYCIDTLFKVIEEGDQDKIYNFADLIHNMPDIFLGKRNFYSFRKEIKYFNEKYHEDCFDDMTKIYPYFSKKAPKNAFEFFSPKSDEDFKVQHPIGYWILVASGIVALVLPLFFYTIYISVFNEAQSVGGWPLLAIVGCIVMGVGLFNIVAAFIHQYLGHKLTAICLLGGGTVVALSIFMTQHPELYDQNVSIFYFVSLFMLFLPAIFYAWFRSSVGTWLNRSKRISKSRFRKLTKGKKNYWWYETLHKEEDLGLLYYLNKAFTILYVLIFALTLLTGFIKVMSLILCPMNVILYVLTAFMVIFSRIQDNLDFHGKPFVVFAKSYNNGIDSVIFDIFMVLFVFAMAYVNMMLTGNIWGISLPHL
jgi:hypothetical protein